MGQLKQIEILCQKVRARLLASDAIPRLKSLVCPGMFRLEGVEKGGCKKNKTYFWI